MKFKILGFAGLALATALINCSMVAADIRLDNWNVDDFNDSGSVDSWGINLTGSSSVGPVTLDNTITGETLTFSSIAGTLGGSPSTNAVFLDDAGDQLGIDNQLDPNDSDDRFDEGEGIQFTFGSSARLVNINLSGMNDNERTFLFINGVHEFTLLDAEDMGMYPGININSPGSDDFEVNIAFDVGDTLEFRANVDAGQNGLRVDTLDFNTQAIPEPSAMALLGVVAIGVLGRRRK